MIPPTISYLANIYFEPGALRLLPDLLKQLNITRPLVVTDRGLVAMGMVERLEIAVPAVFDQIETNPSESAVVSGCAAFGEHGCDGVVALGGGSPIDCAKCVALLVNHEPPLEQYAYIRGGRERITANQPPVFAIPTTAGTGSEVGRAALITMRSGAKLAVLSPHLIPDAVICDPELTTGMPPALTAGTGMDAVSHCVENFSSPDYNPIADAIALDGLGRAAGNIRAAVRDGTDLEARTQMMVAALAGGLTFQKGLGFIHCLSHPLGALEDKKLHHGTLNAVFLPHVLRFNAPSCPQMMDRMARVLGLDGGEALADYFERLSAQIGLPARLRDMGLARDDLEPLATSALNDHCAATNPRPITVGDCEALYDAAW